MKEITGEWLEKAEEDYIVANREYSTDPPVYNAVCFHAQQCIEKLLKAILQENEILFPKTHDLTMLVDACAELIPALKEDRDAITRLSIYAVDVRYPGTAVSEKEAGECIAILQDLKPKLKDLL